MVSIHKICKIFMESVQFPLLLFENHTDNFKVMLFINFQSMTHKINSQFVGFKCGHMVTIFKSLTMSKHIIKSVFELN